MAATATMKRPETVALTYDKANPVAKKTLDFFLSLGIFQIQKATKSRIETGLEEYRQGKYTVINKAKEARKFFNSIHVDMTGFKFDREEANER